MAKMFVFFSWTILSTITFLLAIHVQYLAFLVSSIFLRHHSPFASFGSMEWLSLYLSFLVFLFSYLLIVHLGNSFRASVLEENENKRSLRVELNRFKMFHGHHLVWLVVRHPVEVEVGVSGPKSCICFDKNIHFNRQLIQVH